GEARALGENVDETRGEAREDLRHPVHALHGCSRGIDLGAVAGGKDDTFAETLPAGTAGGKVSQRAGQGVRGNGEAFQDLQRCATMADPDAGNRGNKWGGGAHFGSVSPRQRALNRVPRLPSFNVR